jgi:hypothetical protein
VKRQARIQRWCVLGGLTTMAVGLVVAWVAHDACYRIPQGPNLPPAPPDREYPDEVIAPNDEAGEIQWDDPDAALRLYDEALGIDSAYHLAYANKAQVLMRREDCADAAGCGCSSGRGCSIGRYGNAWRARTR